jgi:hypothetical protein
MSCRTIIKREETFAVKNKLLIFVILAVALLGLLDKGDGLAGPPLMPSSFYGTVKINGSNVPLTTKVSAWINGIKYAETTVIMYNADTVYSLDVPGDIAGTPEIEGGKPGDLIVFYIDNQAANKTGIWQSGTHTELNLSAFIPDGSFKLFLPIIIN